VSFKKDHLIGAFDYQDVKDDWRSWKFSDLATNIVEKVAPKKSNLEHYICLKHLDSGSLHISRFGKTSEIEGDKLKIYKGDLIFAKRNSYLKRVAVAKFDAVASAHSMVLRANKANVDPDFLAFFMLSETFWEKAIEISVGSLSPTINWKVLAKQEFLLPPLTEQQKLLEVFKHADELVLRDIYLKEKTEILRDVNREKLYTYGIKGLHESSAVNLVLSKCGLIRSDIMTSRFFDCVEIASGQVDPASQEYCDLYQIGSERIEPNTGKITELKTAKELGVFSGNYLFTEKDVIYSKIRPYFKKVANPDFTGLCSADIYPLRPKNDGLLKGFLFYYLLTEKFTRRLLRFQNRTGMPKVNREELGAMYIPLPSSEEQQAIVDILDRIDDFYVKSENKLESSQKLLNSIINQVF
jgi:type I restriction enzyme S subunit